jgi:hypothetical protein
MTPLVTLLELTIGTSQHSAQILLSFSPITNVHEVTICLYFNYEYKLSDPHISLSCSLLTKKPGIHKHVSQQQATLSSYHITTILRLQEGKASNIQDNWTYTESADRDKKKLGGGGGGGEGGGLMGRGGFWMF